VKWKIDAQLFARLLCDFKGNNSRVDQDGEKKRARVKTIYEGNKKLIEIFLMSVIHSHFVMISISIV
jgi:hypothetical protein